MFLRPRPGRLLFSLSTLFRGRLRPPTTSSAALTLETLPPPCTPFCSAFQELLSLNSSPPTLLLLREETHTIHQSQGLDSTLNPLLPTSELGPLLTTNSPTALVQTICLGRCHSPHRAPSRRWSSSPHSPLPQGLCMCYSSTLNTSHSLTAWPAPTYPLGRKLLFHSLTTRPSQAIAPPHGSQHIPVPFP